MLKPDFPKKEKKDDKISIEVDWTCAKKFSGNTDEESRLHGF